MFTTQPASSQVEPVKAAGSAIGDAVAASRVRRGLTQLELARDCGFSVRTMSKIESGDVTVSLKSLLRVAHQLGVLDAVAAAFAPPRGGRARSRR